MKSLNEDDYVLIRETKHKNLKELDEDALIDLHQRIRRARNKYVGVYRRAKRPQKVASKKARGQVKSANKQNHERAEAFEDALAKVSLRLSTVAAQAALELKEERLARARGASSFADLPDGGKVGSGATGKTSAGRMRVDATRNRPAARSTRRPRVPRASGGRARRNNRP